jgi:predicted transcriptional regulator
MKEYLPFLLQNELIKYGNKDGTFTITNKGLHFLKMYNALPDL